MVFEKGRATGKNVETLVDVVGKLDNDEDVDLDEDDFNNTINMMGTEEPLETEAAASYLPHSPPLSLSCLLPPPPGGFD
ncbi:hypothetical protein PanWU01x14_027890 [Parasponia andersonii]|uniref:Uncharacterized protein n=1 Tax=Parasponia andersonii TaxID=3476 RepID=A0A2P5DV60_PARAD|nr:hypothetical protein PanWU01x14_027890 [Parasponia andersonii]